MLFIKMGRDTGVEPVHARFTAECVHRFTNRATGTKYRDTPGFLQDGKRLRAKKLPRLQKDGQFAPFH